MNKIDLHIHSNYSIDGEIEVEGIISKCTDNQTDTFSITDHNSVLGIGEAVEACASLPINFIPGIEIDCSYRGTDLHVLGYNIDWRGSDFSELEKTVGKKILDSFSEMLENLSEIGIDVDSKEVMAKANGKLPCAELIAEVLLADKNSISNEKLRPYLPGGARSDMPYINFYHDFFAQGQAAYVKIEYMTFSETIELVRSNGGIPIIAHPGLNFKNKEWIVTELLERGAAGLEIFNNYHDDKQIAYFAELVVGGNYLMTCGSDFHGKNKPLIDIGHFKFNREYGEYLSRSVELLTNTSGYNYSSTKKL